MTISRKEEFEATQFAIELLMPWEWVERDMEGIDPSDDRAVKRLANKYGVPPTIMSGRLFEIWREKNRK